MRCHRAGTSAPSHPIERDIAEQLLLARVLTSKYVEHTPLYRQSEIYARQGMELSRSVLSGWVDACCRAIKKRGPGGYGPIYGMTAMQAPCYLPLCGSPTVRTEPQTHLADFSGVLQADAYAGCNELYRQGYIKEAVCWVHTRRKIHDVHVRTPSPLTEKALKRIGELYAIEAEIR